MNGTRKINSIKIQMNDKDARDISDVIEIARNEGVYSNRANAVKTILDALLHKRV